MTAEPSARSADPLPDEALVVRGGLNAPEQFTTGSGVTTDNAGRLSGVSVHSAADVGVEELAQYVPNNQIGVSTVGAVRAAGGDVIREPTRNLPYHCEMRGVTAETASKLFTPTRRNPTPKEERWRP
jgi:hypothetical protein